MNNDNSIETPNDYKQEDIKSGDITGQNMPDDISVNYNNNNAINNLNNRCIKMITLM